MSGRSEPERWNEHGQDSWPERPEEKGWDREMTPGMDEFHDRELERWAAFLREVLPLKDEAA